MAIKEKVVSDSILGKLTKKFWDLFRHVDEGSVDPKRAEFFMQLAAAGNNEPQYFHYVLEIHWTSDNAHYKFITIDLESYDDKFEDLLDSEFDQDRKVALLKRLHQLHYGTVDCHLIRLYRKYNTRFFGYSPECITRDYIGHVEEDLIDLSIRMKPIIEFDEAGNPRPFKKYER